MAMLNNQRVDWYGINDDQQAWIKNDGLGNHVPLGSCQLLMVASMWCAVEYRNRYCMDQLDIFEAWRHFLCIPLFQSMLQSILFLCSTNANPKSANKHPVYDYYVTGQCVTVLRLLHYVCVHTEHIFMTDWTIWTHLRHTLNRWIGYNYMISTLTNDLISKYHFETPTGLQHMLGTPQNPQGWNPVFAYLCLFSMANSMPIIYIYVYIAI